MYLDYAPLEGITTSLYRRLHHQYFPGVDRYYSPFLSPTQDHLFTARDKREVFPEFNEGYTFIPQLLTKNADDFLWAAGELHAMGYGEVNLNLGCPSGTVTAKGKGSGMLRDLPTLERFLNEIYDHAPCKISIKTRLGMDDPEEFHQILEIYNQFPVSELIIHPRVRKDFYRHPVRLEAFENALQICNKPVSYNGSVITPREYQDCALRYPGLTAIMIGQGLVSDPFLAGRIKCEQKSDKALLRSFLEDLVNGYAEQFGNRLNAAKRMKDIWFYLIRLFDDSDKHGKRILKAKTAEEYEIAVSAVFQDLTLRETSSGGW